MRLDLDDRFEMRIPSSLKKTFTDLAQAQDMDAAQLARRLMRDYVQQNAQGDLLAPKPARRKASKAK